MVVIELRGVVEVEIELIEVVVELKEMVVVLVGYCGNGCFLG